MSVDHLCNRTFTVTRPVFGQTGTGGTKAASTSTIVSGEPCRVRKLSEQERSLLGRESAATTHRLYCRAGLTILPKDTATLDDGLAYDVVGADDPHSLCRHLVVDLARRP